MLVALYGPQVLKMQKVFWSCHLKVLLKPWTMLSWVSSISHCLLNICYYQQVTEPDFLSVAYYLWSTEWCG